MKKLTVAFLSVALLLTGCAQKQSKPLITEPEKAKVALGQVPYEWKVPKNILDHITVRTPNNEYSAEAQNNGAQAQALVYYKPISGEETIFMAVFYFPVNSYLAANRPIEPPSYGSKVVEENNMILSIAGPQDSIYDPQTADGKNIDLLYKTLYDASNFSKVDAQPINAGEFDTVSSWTSAIVNQSLTDLAKKTKLTPQEIYQYTKKLKDSYPDGDAGLVSKTLTGAKVSFRLYDSKASAYLFLDNNGKLSSTEVASGYIPTPLKGCFMGSLKQDRYYLTIQTQDGVNVTGNISIRNYQKDSSTGNFKGTFDGTVITGVYTFRSEGTVSERELFFKVSDGAILQGFGPVEEIGNTAKFVRPLAINWDNSYLLKYSTNCKN